jgi:hypothetical protein
MGDTDMRQASEQLLTQARALLAAYPDAAALLGLPVRPLPGGDQGSAFRAPLRHLRDEMVLVQEGKVGGVGVLADEIACVERELARR